MLLYSNKVVSGRQAVNPISYISEDWI